MPKGPHGQKRPGDVIGGAVKVARIATGEDTEETPSKADQAKSRARGKARAKALTAEERSDIARLAATARWKKGST